MVVATNHSKVFVDHTVSLVRNTAHGFSTKNEIQDKEHWS